MFQAVTLMIFTLIPMLIFAAGNVAPQLKLRERVVPLSQLQSSS